ncbi:hypothetical protein R6Z07F_017711 [Ovis aries]
MGRSPGEGHDSILAWRIPKDREAWRVTVHGVAKSQTQQSDEAQHTALIQCGWVLMKEEFRTQTQREDPVKARRRWPSAGRAASEESKSTNNLMSNLQPPEIVTHQLSGHEFEQTLGDSEGQGSLAYCSPWVHKESDTTE